MQCYTELTPPTAVTHSVNLPFLSATANNLVVARTSLLQIFTLKQIERDVNAAHEDDKDLTNDDNAPTRLLNDDEGLESSFLGTDTLLLRTENVTLNKLVLVAEYPLAGTVTSLARVKTLDSRSGGESLLVALKDAKLSLLQWDPIINGLTTISIHFYEQEGIQSSPWVASLGDYVNYLTTDPQSRCAALKFGDRSVAILPIRQADEDIAMDDWDEELDGPRPELNTNEKSKDGTTKDQTPYVSSFVLRLPNLDPSMIFHISIAFLHEYREPTFGILSSTVEPSSGLFQQRRDVVSYTVFTLDLEQRASTSILAVSGLPYDLFKVIPLPTPIGGALLVGGNELIHIDQSGKANGLAVNIFAKQSTSFGLADQSDLEMRLEDSVIELISLESKEMLIILNTGELAILSFRMDGRSISGLSIRRISNFMTTTRASTVSILNDSSLFIGSEQADSIVLGWSRKAQQSTRKRSRADGSLSEPAEFEEEEEDDFDDDDLYGDAPTTHPTNGLANGTDASKSKAGDYEFRVHDTLLNIAPLKDITFGKRTFSPDSEAATNSEGLVGDLELVAATGAGRDSALSIINREVEPRVIGRFDFPEARGVWTTNVKKPIATMLQSKGKQTPDPEAEAGVQFDRLMIVSKAPKGTAEESAVYALTPAGFETLTGTEFEPAAGATIEAGTLGRGMRLIQVLKSEVRSYDGDLGLAQILPMMDEETEAEPKVLSASLADPFLLLIREDGTIFVAQCDDNNELDEVERPDGPLTTMKWLSGCLYSDINDVFTSISKPSDKMLGENVLMFLLSESGAMHIFSLPDLQCIYVVEGISFLPPTLSPSYTVRRTSGRVQVKEILVANLGDSISRCPHLLVRAENDDITIYQPFRAPELESAKDLPNLYFSKVSNPHISSIGAPANSDIYDQGEQDSAPMRVLPSVGGYSCVFIPGDSPSFIIKSSQSIPKVISLRGTGVWGLSSFHTAGCDRGFIYSDYKGTARVAQLPKCDFTSIGFPLRRIKLGEVIHNVTFHPTRGLYVIATSVLEGFELPKDDDSHHRDWHKEDLAFKPLAERGSIKLVDPITSTIIHTIELDPCEIALCVETLNLEVSETTHERKHLITVGTATSKGEDLAIKGSVRVYDIVTVVPEPDRPETDKRLKLLAREDNPRGAITALSEIGSQGFMLVAQGQKCMVRGLKEDGTLLPVAFMDVNCYVTAVKELPGTGLCLIADAVKGVWLVGYTEEPYRMSLFGKSTTNMEVLTAALLPDGKELYVVVADANCNLHILQYDPEHPKSLQGHLLLHRTSFSLGGHLPTTMTLLPRTRPVGLPSEAMNISADSANPESEVLITSTTGAIGVLNSLTESQYRRLSTLASHLSNTLYHACGLNPKAYRISKDSPEGILGGRTIVDGSMLMRWNELGSQRRTEVAGRVGMDVDEVRDDIEVLDGGLGYF